MKRKIELRLKHYNKCGYNDSHLVFRTTGEDRAMKVEKEQAAKAATDSNKIPKTKKERKKPKTKKEGKKPETKEPEEPEEPEPEEERPMTVKEGKKPEKKPETKKEGKRKRSDAADPGEAGGQSKKKKPKK
ncbi:hypothetical protein MMC11_000356 [Xylographa trunciseda]|nr:hypothetical protein [Xylographa trunciseda]